MINKGHLFKFTAFSCFMLLCVDLLIAQNTNSNQQVINYPTELTQLAESIDMIPINGEDFERTDYYGGQGLPFVFGILKKPTESTGIIPPSVLFWCRKDGKEYLVYALYNFSEKKYEVQEVISEAKLVGHEYDLDDSFGMIAYDGVLGVEKDLSHFIYLNNREKNGPKDVLPTPENGFLPVIIYNENSVQVLYYYKDKWLTYVESDI